MKGGKNLRDLQAHKAKQVEEMWVKQPICCVCNRKCEGYYSRHGDTGTCSQKCMNIQDTKPKYGEHTEKAFLKRFNL